MSELEPHHWVVFVYLAMSGWVFMYWTLNDWVKPPLVPRSRPHVALDYLFYLIFSLCWPLILLVMILWVLVSPSTRRSP